MVNQHKNTVAALNQRVEITPRTCGDTHPTNCIVKRKQTAMRDSIASKQDHDRVEEKLPRPCLQTQNHFSKICYILRFAFRASNVLRAANPPHRATPEDVMQVLQLATGSGQTGCVNVCEGPGQGMRVNVSILSCGFVCLTFCDGLVIHMDSSSGPRVFKKGFMFSRHDTFDCHSASWKWHRGVHHMVFACCGAQVV